MTNRPNNIRRIRLAKAAAMLGCCAATVKRNKFGFRLHKMNPALANSPYVVDEAEVIAFIRREGEGR